MRHESEELTEADVREALQMPRDFGYSGDLDLGNTWALGPVIRTRDSTLLDQSNAAALEKALEQAVKSKEIEKHSYEVTSSSHWAVGWVEHLSYRVIGRDGKPTRVAGWVKGWFDYLKNEYPIADEEDYSEREHEATIANIESEGHSVVSPNEPRHWAAQVYSWLYENNQSAVENRDDQGGYPSRDEIREAAEALGLTEPEED